MLIIDKTGENFPLTLEKFSSTPDEVLTARGSTFLLEQASHFTEELSREELRGSHHSPHWESYRELLMTQIKRARTLAWHR